MVNSRWAIVHRNGYINHGYMFFTRRDVIQAYLEDFRGYRDRIFPGLTDAQFWRLMKRKRRLCVRRVVLKVARKR